MTDITSQPHMFFLLSALFLIPVSSQHPTPTGVLRGHGLDSTLDSLIRNDDRDHRVILYPGRWKIRTPAIHSVYVTYHFLLGFNWTELEVNYPECSQVACRGLPDSHQGCDHLCSTGTWHDATITLKTSTVEYNRAMASLDAAFNDLAALMDTHIVNRQRSVSDPVSKLLSYHDAVSASDPQIVDVMQYYRTLIDEALKDVGEHFPGMLSYAPLNTESILENRPVLGSNNPIKFNELLDTWKSGAFKLAGQLNSVTFIFQGAQQRLQSCAQGVQRLDMTGCEPGFITGFYTDIPVASRSLSSSRLVMVVKRDRWNPLALSRWYMPFIDSSKGNRTCWLDRPMVSDNHVNYRVPQCDCRGVCEPLEPDNDTLLACEVNETGEISLACPVVCGSPCFGPICYQSQSNTYTLRTAYRVARDIDVENDQNVVQVKRSPRMLSKVYSLSELDIQTSLAGIRNRSTWSSVLVQRGETVLHNIIAMDVTARKYIDKVYADNTTQSQGPKCVDCEHMIHRSQFMAAVSVTLSALTCPLLIIVSIKLRSSARDQDVQMRTRLVSAKDFL